MSTLKLNPFEMKQESVPYDNIKPAELFVERADSMLVLFKLQDGSATSLTTGHRHTDLPAMVHRVEGTLNWVLACINPWD